MCISGGGYCCQIKEPAFAIDKEHIWNTNQRTLTQDEEVALELVHGDAVQIVENPVRCPHEQDGKVLVEPLSKNFWRFWTEEPSCPRADIVGLFLRDRRRRVGLARVRQRRCDRDSSAERSRQEELAPAAAAAANRGRRFSSAVDHDLAEAVKPAFFSGVVLTLPLLQRRRRRRCSSVLLAVWNV